MEDEKMIHDKKILLKEAQRIANENGAPVWYEYNLKFSAYFIHETPPPDYKKNITIIEPEVKS
jgi:hypothetical protein